MPQVQRHLAGPPINGSATLPDVRNQTIRRKIKSRLRDATSSDDKLRAIRALYIMVYNDDKSLIPLTTELFHAVGEILEGIKPEELSLTQVDKYELLKTIEALF